jgi:hypothetical protein
MSIQALVIDNKRMFLADTLTGALDDYERNEQGVYRRHVHNQLEPALIGGIQEELAKKYSTDEAVVVWRTLASISTLPAEFTETWLIGEIGKK